MGAQQAVPEKRKYQGPPFLLMKNSLISLVKKVNSFPE